MAYLSCTGWCEKYSEIKKNKLLLGLVTRGMDISPKLPDPFLDFLNMANENYLYLLLEIQYLFIARFNFLDEKYRFQCVVNNRTSPCEGNQHP